MQSGLPQRRPSRSPWRRRRLGFAALATGCAVLCASVGAACGKAASPAWEPVEPLAPPAHVAWIAAGGGTVPSDNQVSIEADLALVSRVLGPADGGVTLFAGGPATHGVQVADRAEARRGLIDRLGDLFDPRPGRDASYRRTTLSLHGASTEDGLRSILAQAVASGTQPLDLYLVGHGQPADAARDVVFNTWGGGGLDPVGLGEIVAAGARPVRVIASSCYSGGFAELAFAGADAEAGAAHQPLVCALLAATWDRPSSGCDADPDRRRHESYNLHLLHALQGADRRGQPRSGIDLDGDGRISRLEAHARARVASRGFDVPTSTSERWLRRHGTPVAPDADLTAVRTLLPDEVAVIAGLSERLGLRNEGELQAALGARRAARDQAEDTARAASDAEGQAYERAAAALLARWPVLDDPYHPDYRATLRQERDALNRWFDKSTRYAAFVAQTDRAAAAAVALDALELELAPYLRLERAWETLRIAAQLVAEGGPAWQHYLRLRSCEAAL